MACLNTYNNASFIDPRISFSNDFADATQQVAIKHKESNYTEAPASSDFEFCARNFNIVPADEIFFRGMLVPVKENNQLRKMTLREELLADVDELLEDSLPRQQQKGSTGWWKERLGLKRAQMVSKKVDRSSSEAQVMEKIVEEKFSS